MISVISLKIAQKPPSALLSFGFHRAEILGALLSIIIIWGLTVWLLVEAIVRLISPSSVDGLIMLLTAIGGLVGNTIMGIVAGAIIYSHPDYTQADPICTLIFAVLVMSTTWPIVRDSTKVLMESTPEDIDTHELTKIVEEIEEIKEMHDLHI